jgi:uncharacterized protein (TIGR02271 family)
MPNRNLSTQVHEGMDVLDRNGEKIGKAGETMPDGRSFNLDTGFLGIGKEYYVPFDAIREVQENSIYLTVAKGQLDRLGWDQRPEERPATTARGTARTAATEDERTVQLREEELRARTTPVETGRVQVGKEVVEEERSFEVPVSREEVYVERKPGGRRPADAPIDEREETIRVPVHEERVEVEKRPVVTEEVEVGKRTVRDTRQVSGTVRREELRTDKEGDVPVTDERPPTEPRR